MWLLSCVSVSLGPNFLLQIWTPVIEDLGRPLIQDDLIFTGLHLQRPCVQTRSCSQVPGGHGFWGHCSIQHRGDGAVPGGSGWETAGELPFWSHPGEGSQPDEPPLKPSEEAQSSQPWGCGEGWGAGSGCPCQTPSRQCLGKPSSSRPRGGVVVS